MERWNKNQTVENHFSTTRNKFEAKGVKSLDVTGDSLLKLGTAFLVQSSLL